MSTDAIRALVRYRIEQSEKALKASRLLFEADLLHQAVGRAYYAMFYAVLALLAFRGLGTSRHSGVLSLFDREYVKEGLFGQKQSRNLHELFDLRQRADYREMFDVSSSRAEFAIISAKQFVEEIREYFVGKIDLEDSCD